MVKITIEIDLDKKKSIQDAYDVLEKFENDADDLDNAEFLEGEDDVTDNSYEDEAVEETEDEPEEIEDEPKKDEE
jgi:hypothetical protein